jgi:hypothetical protein
MTGQIEQKAEKAAPARERAISNLMSICPHPAPDERRIYAEWIVDALLDAVRADLAAIDTSSSTSASPTADEVLDQVEEEIERRVTETFTRGSNSDLAVRQVGFQSVRAVRRRLSSTPASTTSGDGRG